MKVFLLAIGDCIVLYLTLFATLILRYGGDLSARLINQHLLPFSIIFGTWIIVFYIAGLYDLRRLRNNVDFLKILGSALFVNAFLALGFFYLAPAFGITPKTNLFIFIALFAALEIFWRRTFNVFVASRAAPLYKVVLIGEGPTAEKIYAHLTLNPQLGYAVTAWLKEKEVEEIIRKTNGLLESEKNIVIVPPHFKRDTRLAALLYELLNRGVEIHDSSRFYEHTFRAVPLEDLEETWFLENMTSSSQAYEFVKRMLDVVFALVLLGITLPLWVVIATLIFTTSGRPTIFSQSRVGKNRKEFTLYKFRTMRVGAPHAWPGKNDARITPVGKFLRKLHFDELPQAVNVLRGDISIVGPRPDFADFYKTLEKEIPYYSIRTIIRPGLTGWAQVNYPVTASLEQTKERLRYDLYYIKNRSIALDIATILKTIRVLLTARGR